MSNIFEERKAQLGELVDYYKNTIDKAPLIISGDLNAEPDSEEMELILKSFAVSDFRPWQYLFHKNRNEKKIDFILFPNNANWEVVEIKRICRVDASDHCALLTVLKFSRN